MHDILFLLLSLLFILISAEGFTNGVESLGRRFSFSQAVVGSILAAVGTALPETILPVVAIFFYKGHSAKDIGIGAILGAPFMLSTLAFFLVGLTASVSYIKKRRPLEITIEAHSTRRDLFFFLPMYSFAVFVPMIAGRAFSLPAAALLIGSYIFYAYMTFKGESADLEHSEEMYLWKILNRIRKTDSADPHFIAIMVQIIVALSVMIFGAHVFVQSLEHISTKLGLSPLLFSLMIAPIATELPEKFNSVSWTWKGRDTLAIGNITGAMVFQTTFPVSVGLLFTGWHITGLALFSAILALTSSLIVLAQLSLKKKLSPFTLFIGGALYLVYAGTLIFWH